jgi:hypothetical protein
MLRKTLGPAHGEGVRPQGRQEIKKRYAWTSKQHTAERTVKIPSSIFFGGEGKIFR